MALDNSLEFFNDRAVKHYSPCHYLDPLMDFYAWQLRKKALFENVDFTNKKVLDIGCGDGQWIPPILDKGAKCVVGIDQAPVVLSHAQSKLYPAQYTDKCSLLCWPGEQLCPSFESLFDTVLMITSWNFISPSVRSTVIENISKYLTSFGEIVVLEYLPRKVPSYQENLDYKWVWPFSQTVEYFSRFNFHLEHQVKINFLDTKLFHFFGSNVFTYCLTKFIDSFIFLIPSSFCAYRLLIFRKMV